MKNPIFLLVTVPSVIALSCFFPNLGSTSGSSKIKNNTPKEIVTTTSKDSIKNPNFITIDVLDTYERILRKEQYNSVEILKKVANGRYFRGDYVKSAKWYSILDAKNPNLEVEYYYRYAKSLEAIGETDKSVIQMKKFEDKKSVK